MRVFPSEIFDFPVCRQTAARLWARLSTREIVDCGDEPQPATKIQKDTETFHVRPNLRKLPPSVFISKHNTVGALTKKRKDCTLPKFHLLRDHPLPPLFHINDPLGVIFNLSFVTSYWSGETLPSANSGTLGILVVLFSIRRSITIMNKTKKKEETEPSCSTFGNLALGFFLIQTVAIGILPTVLGWNSLAVCSWGSLSYGIYAFVRPGRIMYRMKPKVPPGSSPEFCVKDLMRVWALFCLALGAMGLSIQRASAVNGEGGNGALTMLQFEANAVFFMVALVSMAWDWHLMKSKHWGAEHFLLVNLAANAAISIASASGMMMISASPS